MANFFTPNIDRSGRIARLIFGVLLILAAVFLARYSWWACGLLAVSGVFAIYEAFRGWCVMRACGVKTKL
jgi:hypothetical protein